MLSVQKKKKKKKVYSMPVNKLYMEGFPLKATGLSPSHPTSRPTVPLSQARMA